MKVVRFLKEKDQNAVFAILRIQLAKILYFLLANVEDQFNLFILIALAIGFLVVFVKKMYYFYKLENHNAKFVRQILLKLMHINE